MELSEELQEQNTNFKELFVAQNYEELKERLAALGAGEWRRLTLYNHAIVERYFHDGRLDLIRRFITFVAYASFLVEYGEKQGVIAEEEGLLVLYQELFEALQEESERGMTEE